MHTLNILSLNVNGLNSAVKRTRVLEYLHRKSISCALIQETHLKQSDVARFQNKYYKLAAFSSAQNKTKGVLILVNRKLNLTIEHLGSDEKGRFVFIRCKIYNNRLVLVSIYGPNETDSAFLFFVINNFLFYFFHTHTQQHNIQNTTKQNNRHILNISRSNQKGGGEGRTTRTQKLLLYIITYIQQKTLPSINGRRPGPTNSRRCTFT